MLRIAVACLLVCACPVRTIAQEVWQAQASGTTSTLWGVAYGIGQFVAVGDGGLVLTSPDGVAWSRRLSGTDKSLRGVAWGTDSYIAVGDGGIVLQSPDAVNWFTVSVKNATPDWRLNGVSFWSRSESYGDRFFAVGEDGLIVLNTRSGGIWTGTKEPSARWALRGALAEGDYTHAVGQQGLISVSSVSYDFDGGVRGSLSVGELNAITQDADRIVAVGQRGSVWIKSTGIPGWSPVTDAARGDLFGVTFFDGSYVAVGAGGAVWTARDPRVRWSLMPSATTDDLRGVAASANAAVAVGGRGTILRLALVVSGAPVVLEPPAAATSLVGGAAGFAVKAGGAPPLRYEWLRDGQIVAGATSRVLVIPVLGASDAGRYSVRVTNEIGSITSPTAQLTVGPAPATPIVDPRFRADAQLDVEPPAGSNQSPEAVHGIVPLLDGRVIIGLSGNGRSRLLRLLADGRIDPLFLAKAMSSLDLRRVQPDGRLLVTGPLTALGDSSSGLFRVMDDGTVDPSFTPLVSQDLVRQAFLQNDGKIVVSSGNGRVFRLLSNGQVDPDFQPFTITGSSGGFGVMALAPDGKIYRAVPNDGLRRFLSDGRPDTAFVSPLAPSASSPFLGSKGFSMLTGPDGRIIVDYQTWNGSGGTSVSWATNSLQILANGSIVGWRSDWLSMAVAPDGTLISTYGNPSGNPVRDPPYFAIWSSFGAAPLSMNWGVATPSGPYVAAFGPDNELWLGGSFSFYNGVRSPRIVRLNRVTSEVAAPPVLLGTWAESATIPFGEVVTIHAPANSDGPVTYEWNLNGDSEWTFSSSIRRTVAPTRSFQPTSPGPWRWAVRARNSAGSSAVAKGSVMVAPPPFTVASIPQRVSAQSGRDASLVVTVPSVVALTNAIWRRDGAPLPSANVQAVFLPPFTDRGTAYLLRSVSAADAGAYSATLTRSNGEAIEVGPIVVTVDDTSRITNFSVRAWVGAGGQSAITGFAIPPGPARHVLVRGVGPTLGAFGVPDPLANPKIELFSAFGSMARNDDWSEFSVPLAPVAGAAGAFPLPARSLDAALSTRTVQTVGLSSGGYTVQLTGDQNTTGTALLELYESDNVSDRLANFSARAWVRPNENIIAGFAIRGSVNKRVLIRAAGPTLSALGVAGTLLNPRLELRDEGGRFVTANDDWQSQTEAARVAEAAVNAGAFAFGGGSKDAALLLTLPPGNYSAIVTGTGGESGVALIEVYDVQ